MDRSLNQSVSETPDRNGSEQALPAAVTEYTYVCLDTEGEAVANPVPGEYALSINYNGVNDSVMMVSPDHLEDFLIGYSLTHNIINHPEQIRQLSVDSIKRKLIANIELSPRADWSLKQKRRLGLGTSGCGLCGEEALEYLLNDLPQLSANPLPSADVFCDLRSKLTAYQSSVHSSGARHAAFYVSPLGQVELCREDIGRHNALDKLIGALAQASVESAGFVVVTSRCGLELVQKAIRAKITTLVTLSAPTSMAVDWARQYQLNLIHLPHHSSPRVYSGL